MRKGYKEMTYTKRIELETLLKAGYSVIEAARMLNVCEKTVYNELHRGKYTHTKSDLTTQTRYSAQIAQEKRDYNVSARGTIPKVLKDKKLAKAIEEKIVDKGYSPEAAIETMVRSGEMDKYEESVCVKTVYNSIDKGFFTKITNKDLPVKRNKNKKDYKKIHRIKKACAGTSIEDRPEDILEREEFGHMEMDSVIGKREKGSTLLTIIERKTRNIIVKKQPDKTSKSVVETLDELERELGDVFYKLFKTITVDNGTEFADCAGIERSCVYPGRKRTKVYYCHPYASCERGSNENGNRMIRRKIPKGTSINGYSKEEIQQIEDWVNEYPRRMFGYRSSKDLYKEEMKCKIVGIVFYVCVLFAGMSSLVNLYEAPVATIQEKLKLNRVASVGIIAVAGCVVSLVIQGIVSGWMDAVSIYICPLGAMLAAIMFFWVAGKKFAVDAVNAGADKPIGKWFVPLGKYVLVPLSLVALIAGALLGGIG